MSQVSQPAVTTSPVLQPDAIATIGNSATGTEIATAVNALIAALALLAQTK